MVGLLCITGVWGASTGDWEMWGAVMVIVGEARAGGVHLSSRRHIPLNVCTHEHVTPFFWAVNSHRGLARAWVAVSGVLVAVW